jgi:hypothetical protein
MFCIGLWLPVNDFNRWGFVGVNHETVLDAWVLRRGVFQASSRKGVREAHLIAVTEAMHFMRPQAAKFCVEALASLTPQVPRNKRAINQPFRQNFDAAAFGIYLRRAEE